MRADQARTIDISNYLQYVESITPDNVRMNGRELWYKSPIRENDNTPSFKVDTLLNLWYDHGTLSGGNTLDLVLAIHNCTVSEALAILERSGLYQGSFASEQYTPKHSASRHQTQLSPTTKTPAVEKEKRTRVSP